MVRIQAFKVRRAFDGLPHTILQDRNIRATHSFGLALDDCCKELKFIIALGEPPPWPMRDVFLTMFGCAARAIKSHYY